MIAYPLVNNIIIDKYSENGFDKVKVDFSLSYEGKPFDAEMIGININTGGKGGAFIEFDGFKVEKVKRVTEHDEANIFKVLRDEIMQAFTVV